MVANLDRLFMSPTEYLAWEEEQEFRHEYLDGEAYAMTGGSLNHNSIALNVASALKTRLRGTGCRVFINDVKVQVSTKGPYFYPDVVVACNSDDFRLPPGDAKATLKLISHPRLIIEVLSPGTEGYDRGEKFKKYRQMSSLQEYILIDPRQVAIECYRLNERSKWELTAYNSDELTDATIVEFPSIDFECSIASIYEDVEFSIAS